MFTTFFKPKKADACPPTASRFFSVALGEQHIQAALWEVVDNVKVLAKSEVKTYSSERDLLVALDLCLQELGTAGESVHQTLFHLDNSLLEGTQLSQQQLDFFANLASSLQLESLGFVTNTEAVINARLAQNPDFGKQLVIEFTAKKITFSLYEKKRLLASLTQDFQGDLVSVTKAALVQLASELGEDYTRFFANNQELTADNKEPEALFVNYISLQLSSTELAAQIEKLPESLPWRCEILGNDILLNYILIPSATIIARSLGLMQEEEEEEEETLPAASTPPVEPVASGEPEEPLVLSRQKLAPAGVVVDKNDLASANESAGSFFNKKIIIPAVILGFLVVALLTLFFYVQAAKVEIILEKKTSILSKSLEVTIDPKVSKADYDSFILPGTLKEVEITHEVTIPTSGQKDVGDPAKGKIELINKNTQAYNLKKGTEIENGKLSFSLDEDITLDPAVENEDKTGNIFTKKEAKVTANTKGKAGNEVKKGATFRVGSHVKENLEAVALEDFSGGVEKIIGVYAEADEKKATAKLTEEIGEQASKQVAAREGNSYLTPQLGKLKITKTTASLKIGQEGEQVTVSATASLPVIVYELGELEPLAASFLEKELQPGWQFSESKIEILSGENAAKTARADGKIYLDVDLSRAVERQLDKEQILREIQGQKLVRVQNYLSTNDALSGYQLIWSSKLASQILGKLPSSSDKIQISTK